MAKVQEKERLDAVTDYLNLLTLPQQDLDDLTTLAAAICETPIALISIIDANSLLIKSKRGIEASVVPRAGSFCEYTIQQNGPLIVSDTANDLRFSTSPHVVGNLGVRFYAGTPLITHGGFNVGTLCVLGKEPKLLDPSQIDALKTLARQVVAQFELKLKLKALAESNELCKEAESKAKMLHASKSAFLANMSHEIRTPMNGIIGMTDSLLDCASTVEQKEKLAIIQQCGETLINIINDILDISKIESGKMELENVPFKPSVIVGQAAELFKELARQKGLQINVVIEDSYDGCISSDSHKITQVIYNLVCNALKFTEKGFITITLKTISVSDFVSKIEITVEDSGFGMDRDATVRLFQPYSQASASVARKFGGTGLGLTICKGIADLMQGEILVESECNVGTKFIFRFEARKCSYPSEIHTETFLSKIPESFSVLVAEDNPVNQLVMKDYLAKLGIKADFVDDGAKAVKSCADKKYSLVLMDCQMPILDGLTATKEIKLSSSSLECPTVIAVSASAMPEDRIHCLEAGMDFFLSKPLKFEELKAVIAKSLNRKSAGIR